LTDKAILEKTIAKKVVKLREDVKARKPKFRRHESWRYRRLKENWRKPRGLDNKMRLNVKGWPKSVNIGYGGPKVARGLHPSGYKEVLTHTPDEIVNVDPKTQAIRIAHTVGTRKRIQISSLAREKGIHILNPLIRKKTEEQEETIGYEEEEMPEETISEAQGKEAKAEKKLKRSRRSKPAKEVKTGES
jgi:large subunit ribosomal protein L32e